MIHVRELWRSRVNRLITRKDPPPKNAAPGSVNTQAMTSFLGIFHRTAFLPFAVPTPVMPPAITCVELTGIPKKLAMRITKDEEASATNP